MPRNGPSLASPRHLEGDSIRYLFRGRHEGEPCLGRPSQLVRPGRGSFATAMEPTIPLPPELRWSQGTTEPAHRWSLYLEFQRARFEGVARIGRSAAGDTWDCTVDMHRDWREWRMATGTSQVQVVGWAERWALRELQRLRLEAAEKLARAYSERAAVIAVRYARKRLRR